MGKHLVIVESPAKAKTVNRYLGDDFLVKASMGHIRDLPKNKLGVDADNQFKAEYRIIPEKKKIVGELQRAAEQASTVLLAADPDREGEAICWHLSHLLEKHNPNIRRVLFHEITKQAVLEAFKNQGEIDRDKILAQRTRRILDRLVGYLISPLLWKKIGKGLSAGRVQSIALRLVCEREKEIQAFVSEEYWNISARLSAADPPPFKAALFKIDGQKSRIADEKNASSVVEELGGLPFILSDIRIKEKRKNPPPPYITSTLQQDAFRLRKFTVKKTMALAQKLYEGLEVGNQGLVGLITYMRTDSVRISESAISAARDQILHNFGKQYLPKSPRTYKNKKKAQDAHEAIRPTSMDLHPERVSPYLKKDDLFLYTLIWNRFIASQTSAARIEETEFDISAGRFLFKAKGEVIKFDGFLRLYPQNKKSEDKLPRATAGEILSLLDIESKQNFTQPPPRYTEGTLVKELEAKGIGRPSTYAPIIATIQGRVYVVKEEGKFIPTDLGMFVSDYLVENFPDLMEFKFTANFEEALDLISEGRKDWQDYLTDYYSLLDADLKKAMEQEGTKAKGIPVAETCPECGKQLVIKDGRYGRFKACSGYPDCKFKQSMVKKEVKKLEEACPECGSQLVERRGKYGLFVACSNYPACRYVKKETLDTGIPCPEGGGGTLVRKKTKRGKIFYGCSRFPKCQYATWDEPIRVPCPRCGHKFLLRKNTAKVKSEYCPNPECEYTLTKDPEPGS
jgi:DNA topoisomerase-1